MSSKPHSPIFRAEAQDEALAQAVAGAVTSFKYLWRELTWEYRRIVPALELSAIKVAFKDPEGNPDSVEHMWLSDIEFDGDVISATLLNSPNELTSIKEGDRTTLSQEQIEDWMYVSGGRVYGGFTVQLMRARMSPAERRGHDEAWGFDFAEPSRVLVPVWQEPNNPDAEHPMSESVAQRLAEDLAQDRAAFFELGPAGLNMLHSLALGGSAACVKVLLEAGADPQLKTSSGRTALELAAMMGWPRVVALLREAEAR